MKKVLNLVKKNIIPLIIAIYLSIIFNMILPMNLVGLIIIILLLFIGFNKMDIFSKNKLKKYDFKTLGISILLTILTIACFFNFFGKNYQNTSINIEAENIAITDIQYMIIDNQKYLYQENTFYSTFDIWHNESDYFTKGVVTVLEKDSNHISLDIKKSRSISLNLLSDKKITIHDGDKKFECVPNEECYYKVSSNVKNIINYLKLATNFILLFLFYSVISLFVKTLNKKNKVIWILFGIGLIFAIYNLYNSILCYSTNDSFSYVGYSIENLKHFIPDIARMPLYPLLIHLLHLVFGNNVLVATCYIQYIIWSVSIIYLYKVIKALTNNDILAFCVSLLYLLNPAIFAWNNVILTESIALSGTILFMYEIVMFIKTKEKKFAYKCAIISLILTFIRPTALLYLLGLIGFYIIRAIIDKNNRKTEVNCLTVSFLCFIPVIIYMIVYNNNYGIFSLNQLIIKQDFIVSINQRYYLDSQNDEYIKKIEESLEQSNGDVWLTYANVSKEYDLQEIKKFNHTNRKNNIKKYIFYIINLFKSQSALSFYSYSYEPVNFTSLWLYDSMNKSFAFYNFFHIYLTIVLMGLMILYKFIKKMPIDWCLLGFCAFTFGIIITSFIGTCGEFMRTAITSFQFAYVGFVYVTWLFIEKRKKC